MTHIVISEGGMADLDAVMDIMSASFDPAFGEAWTAAQCASMLTMPGVWLSIARSGDGPLGFALCRHVAGEAELLLLAVKPPARGKGIGAQLLGRFRSSATAMGAHRLHLEVRYGNPAITLYEHAGYKAVGRRKNYYTGVDGCLYDAITLALSVEE